MLFQAFEYDIEFRLELQNFCKENHRVLLETFFAWWLCSIKLASDFKNFHEFINYLVSHKEQIHKMLVSLAKLLNESYIG